MIIDESGRRVAVREDEPSAAYTGVHVARRELASSAGSAHVVRVVVELSQALGGMMMRALLGGEFTPDPTGSVTVFEAPFGEPIGLGADAGCTSELDRPLVAGLPRDFADAVLDGLTGETAARALPTGVLRIGRAGYDEVGSSEMAFKLAGGLLRRVVDALLHDEDPLAAAQTVMSEW